MQYRGRVLCVTSNFPRWPGDSTTPFVLNLASDLQDIGWKVDVLAPHASGATLKETMQGVSVERFRYMWPERLQTVCYEGGALINLRKRPFEKIKLPILVVMEFFALTRRLLTREYDIVHSHWILPQGFTGMLGTRITGIPHVVTVHGGDIFSLRSNVMEGFKRSVLRSADTVTVNSSFTEQATLNVEPEIRSLHRIPMGVDVSPLTPTENISRDRVIATYKSGTGPLIVFVGRLVEEKGCEDAIRAVKILRRRFPDIRLLILGDGQDKEKLKSLAQTIGVWANVNFLGWVDPGDVRAYMAAADIFVGPSRTSRDGWVEAQGLTFIEAMVVGTPVVASRLGGIVDSVEHENTGLLVKERSPDEISRAVERLIEEPALRSRIVESAKVKANTLFSRKVSAENFSEIFLSNLKNSL